LFFPDGLLIYPSDKDFGLELYDNQRQQVGDLLSEETQGGLTRKKTISYSASPGVYYIKTLVPIKFYLPSADIY
jgi:hypothetical protein